MTVGAIMFDLGGGASPFRVTLPDASGLAPLDLPTPFLDDGELRRQPSDDAISRFESAMSGGDAYSALAERPLRIPRGIVVPAPVPVSPPEEAPGRATSTMPPETPVSSGREATTQPRDPTPVAAPISVPVEITGTIFEIKGPVPQEITGTVPEKPLEEQDHGRAVAPRPPDAAVAPTTTQPRDPTPVAVPISVPVEITGTVPNKPLEITGTVPRKPLEEQDLGRAVAPRPPDVVVASATAQPRNPTPVAAPISVPVEITGPVPEEITGTVPEEISEI